MWFNQKDDKHYKIISLKTYAWDRTINNTRRYRKVFDKNEINYLGVAIEFYNKFFDEKDWKTTITFKAFSLNGDKKTNEHCVNTKEYTITKDINTVICDYGWGADEPGGYWEKGDYLWEVYIDNEYIESTKFHIENVGIVTPTNNPYFKVVTLKTYETGGEEQNLENRLYFKQFVYKHTRYIMTEFEFINNVEEEWLCELIFNYYDDSGLLIGVSDNISYVTPKNGVGESYSIIAGWGSKDTSMWLKDNYRVEVVFMDTVVSIIPFSIGDDLLVRVADYGAVLEEDFDPEELNVADELPANEASIEPVVEEPETDLNYTQPIENKPIHELLGELDQLIGLTNIKQKIREYIDYTTYLQIRKQKGIEENGEIKLHSVFTGNPGTGKTTVVKLLGQIYHSMGLLSKGHVLSVESNDLISGYVRQTGENTKKLIEKARGGILFIDEAYILFKEGATNDFGPEAIAALITEMSDGPGDIAIMVAGYPKEMESFINSNPGLKSRFTNYYHFKDFTPTELVDIAKYASKKKTVKLSKKATVKIKKIVTSAFRKRDKTFGNARYVHSIIDEAKMNLGIRLVREYDQENITKELLTNIQEQDVEDLVENNLTERLKLDVDTALLKEALSELSGLIGLSEIKQEVQELIRLTKYYREIDRDVLKAFSMHNVFLGNPGTGKTTVARIIGKVYKALGLLERGHVVEVDGSSLIAGYVGQTSIKTKELIKSAMGGVLFIDEAYAITEGASKNGGNNFGKKAIAALIKEMEDHRGKFSVIVAGYTDNMKHFLETNPGMKSRFDKTFHFIDFTESELWEISKNMFSGKNLKVEKKAEQHLKKYITHLYKQRNKFFGNARSMRKIVEKSIRNQELRMANLPKSKRTKAIMNTLNLEDVLEFDSTKIVTINPKKIGYKVFN
ncbi:MAG: AAA family ATPase [Lutibacter sp.]|uniref:AAA family ATPase n=1 Tax=Lutibacter sp. TaxID=1925666 RepID=UPI001A026F42|nr:AAA family ATPase [Lutibacter sp.]NOR27870.1 AAA family ATPase [Lutibacter sp.]